MSFADRKPFVATKDHCVLAWNGNKKNFRCGLCGYKFKVGDTVRWEFTNDVEGAVGNPLLCIKCDRPRDVIVHKMIELRKEFEDPKFWYLKKNYAAMIEQEYEQR